MTKNRKIFGKGALILSLVLVPVLMAASCRHPCHHRMNPEKFDKFLTWKINDVLDDISASDVQRSQILAIKDRVFKEATELKHGHKDHKARVMKELTADSPDTEWLRAELDAKLDKLRQFAHKRLDDLLEVHSILSPEQRVKLADMIKKHHHDQD